MIRFQGETVSFYVYFRDEANQLFDPDTVEAKLYKPDGTLAETLTLSRIDQGQYSIIFTFAEDAEVGDWYIIVKAEKGSFTEIEKIPITVCEVM